MKDITYPIKGVNLPKTQNGWTKMNKLVSAAEELFSNVSFFETSVVDICKKAGTAVGTFYIYFDSKADIYRYVIETYKTHIRSMLNDSIKGLNSRYEKERAGIKCFVKYAVRNPQVYNVIWGSLAVDEDIFADYYESFASSYARALISSGEELKLSDVKTLSYALMGITNFLGLKAIFEKSTDDEIDTFIDQTVMPLIKNGMFK
ncbi:MAG: TetR/AcrR family transcriptional regulator [Clostridia bacterium]|nr:TetR/AcrR family transcriptional regulator [Clostridia bacterium]